MHDDYAYMRAGGYTTRVGDAIRMRDSSYYCTKLRVRVHVLNLIIHGQLDTKIPCIVINNVLHQRLIYYRLISIFKVPIK